MQLGELATLVLNTVRRPDQESVIRSRVISALRQLSAAAEFNQNWEEFTVSSGSITPSPSNTKAGQLTYDLSLRDIRIVNAYSVSGEAVILELKQPSTVSDMQRRRVSTVNTCYLLGEDKIAYNCSIVPTSFDVMGFVWRPGMNITNNADGSARSWDDVVLAEYSDWLLRLHPQIVVDYVIAYAAAAVGEKDISNTHLSIFQTTHLPVLQTMTTGA